MHKRSWQLILLFFFSSFAVSNAQEFVREFGKVTKEDFDFVKYEKEPNSEAVVLFDKGLSYFVEGNYQAFDLFFERHIRIKVLSNAGLRWADFSVPFYRDGVSVEAVREIQGITYTFENGEVIRTVFDPKTAFDEKLDGNVTLKKFAMPAVKEGSIIDVKYQVFSPFLFRFNDWTFQTKIPTLYSYYEARLIPFYEYVYLIMGGVKLSLNKTFLDNRKYHFGGVDYYEAIYQFATKDVPSFSDEDFLSSEDDFIQKIDFQLSKVTQANGQTREIMTTWPNLISSMEKHSEVGRYVSKSEKLGKDIVVPGVAGAASAEEKVKAIADYVKNTYSWDGYYGKYARKTVNEFASQKSGSSGDINLFLVGLLRANGIDAYPLMISTRGNGRVYKDYPFEHFFNYVIAYVPLDDKKILIDGAERLTPYNELPQRCINDVGLAIREGFEEWVDVKASATLSSVLKSVISINVVGGADSLDFSFKNEASGYEALNLRRKSENSAAKAIKLFSDDEMSIGGLTLTNYETPQLPLLIDYEGKARVEVLNSKLYVAPFLNAPPSENIFEAPSRKYPIDLIFSRKTVYESQIALPEGYSFETLPTNFRLDTPLYLLEYTVDGTDPRLLKISGVFHLKLPIYKAEYYMAIKLASSKSVALFNQKVAVIPTN